MGAVHVLIIGHVLHWLWAGRTLTPIEPSEAMDTLKTGAINAGFIFFALALLATLVFGRWVCGWGCHLLAYQDLMLWILKKLRLRPRAFRSRAMIFIPLIAALYMFVWPLVDRWRSDAPGTRLSLHLTRSGFWDTFPGPGVAVLTLLVCGLVIVYFLGPKGFCTYACPYGAFFGLTDRLARGRIRVSDACRECGECTAACTSNVRVAEEVKLYGMVVDPGCMKCLDCVTVCPNDALSYGFGPIPLGKKPAAPRRAVGGSLMLWEELLAVGAFAVVFFCYRGLYGSVPFLLSLGMGGIGAFLAVKAAQLYTARDVLLQRVRLKVGGRIRPAGLCYLSVMSALAVLALHSGLWRYHDRAGHLAFARSPAEFFGWQYDGDYILRKTDEQRAAVKEGLRHLSFCRKWGLLGSFENHLELAWLHLHDGAPGEAARQLSQAIAATPHSADLWLNLAKIETSRRALGAARSAYLEALSIEAADRARTAEKLGDVAHPTSARVWTEWGMFLAFQGDDAGARQALGKAADFDQGSVPARTALGMLQIRMGEIDAARRSLIHAVKLGPQGGPAHAGLARLGTAGQDYTAAIREYRTALGDREDIPVFHHNMARALMNHERYEEALGHYRKVLPSYPEATDVRAEYGAALLTTGDVQGAIGEYEKIVETLPTNAEAVGKLVFLYMQVGRRQDAVRICRTMAEQGDDNDRAAARAMLLRLKAGPATRP